MTKLIECFRRMTNCGATWRKRLRDAVTGATTVWRLASTTPWPHLSSTSDPPIRQFTGPPPGRSTSCHVTRTTASQCTRRRWSRFVIAVFIYIFIYAFLYSVTNKRNSDKATIDLILEEYFKLPSVSFF